MPNVLTDFAKTSVCASSSAGRPPTVPLGAARDCGGPVSPACAARRTRATSSPSRPEAVDEYPAEVPVVRSRNRKAPPRLARGSSPSVSVRPRPWSTPGASPA